MASRGNEVSTKATSLSSVSVISRLSRLRRVASKLITSSRLAKGLYITLIDFKNCKLESDEGRLAKLLFETFSSMRCLNLANTGIKGSRFCMFLHRALAQSYLALRSTAFASGWSFSISLRHSITL